MTLSQNGKRQATCKYCNTKYEFPNATRMRKHLLTLCTKIAADVKEAIPGHSTDLTTRSIPTVFIQEDKDKDDPMPIASTSSSGDEHALASRYRQSSQASSSSLPLPLPSTNKLLSKKCKLMTGYADFITAKEQEKMDEAIARAVYATATPLSIFENLHWQAAFKLIRPAYKPPSRFLLSNMLLEAEHERVQVSINENINNAKCLCLLSDGWTNCRGEGIINFIITTPKSVFYKAIESNTNRQISDFIFEEFSQVADDVGPGKFMALITDNAANMKSAWKKFTEKYPHTTAFGCAPHSINLFAKDILKLDSIKVIVNNTKL
ncbi:PREDICTED: uncharacterized protein LOC105557685, partial [Vollenhovia emeryi]|uniref:uncharacterized protein LOC105557685 n=1 Tax=Vollenhovia emeryi TaxID=411798 RepID=UPI0005F51FF9